MQFEVAANDLESALVRATSVVMRSVGTATQLGPLISSPGHEKTAPVFGFCRVVGRSAVAST